MFTSNKPMKMTSSRQQNEQRDASRSKDAKRNDKARQDARRSKRDWE